MISARCRCSWSVRCASMLAVGHQALPRPPRSSPRCSPVAQRPLGRRKAWRLSGYASARQTAGPFALAGVLPGGDGALDRIGKGISRAARCADRRPDARVARGAARPAPALTPPAPLIGSAAGDRADAGCGRLTRRLLGRGKFRRLPCWCWRRRARARRRGGAALGRGLARRRGVAAPWPGLLAVVAIGAVLALARFSQAPALRAAGWVLLPLRRW